MKLIFSLLGLSVLVTTIIYGTCRILSYDIAYLDPRTSKCLYVESKGKITDCSNFELEKYRMLTVYKY